MGTINKREHLKEVGFNICAIALGCSNAVTFILIIVTGASQIIEPWKWLLYLEATLDFAFIAWGIERLVGAVRRWLLDINKKGEIK